MSGDPYLSLLSTLGVDQNLKRQTDASVTKPKKRKSRKKRIKAPVQEHDQISFLDKQFGEEAYLMHKDKIDSKCVEFKKQENALENYMMTLNSDSVSLGMENTPIYVEQFLNPKLASKMPEGDKCLIKDELINGFFSYKDVLLSSDSIVDRDFATELACAHVASHVLKTRKIVLKNNENAEEGGDIKDQGYTRPRVLILTPMKNKAFEMIERIIVYSGADQIMNAKRFKEEFDIEGTQDFDQKPESYKNIFKGNLDDCFKIGIKFTKKSIKLYSDFYSSDILVASPLGLRMIIEDEKKPDYDFLSSIEILIVQQTDVYLMQNWEHLLLAIEHLNLMPTKIGETDFSRLKSVYLDTNGKYQRQNIFLSSFLTPEINSLIKKNAFNLSGNIRLIQNRDAHIKKMTKKVNQQFMKFECASFASMNDDRIEYFLSTLEKRIPLVFETGICIFISSYFDFVQIRNRFNEIGLSFASLHDFSSDADISRARSWFFHGQVKYLLITERFVFYKRYQIRGIKFVYFYSLPDYSEFYVDILEMIEGQVPSSIALISRYDSLKLSRIVGQLKTKAMMRSALNEFFIN